MARSGHEQAEQWLAVEQALDSSEFVALGAPSLAALASDPWDAPVWDGPRPVDVSWAADLRFSDPAELQPSPLGIALSELGPVNALTTARFDSSGNASAAFTRADQVISNGPMAGRPAGLAQDAFCSALGLLDLLTAMVGPFVPSSGCALVLRAGEPFEAPEWKTLPLLSNPNCPTPWASWRVVEGPALEAAQSECRDAETTYDHLETVLRATDAEAEAVLRVRESWCDCARLHIDLPDAVTQT
ncbi:MAG: hypothetical protein AAF411_01650 [Myxococcota bacterium]